VRNETKSDLVRRIAAEFGCSHSTSYFVQKCKAFGVEITPQQAHACIGPYRCRERQDSKTLTEAASGLLKACDGDLTMAVRCLKINGGNL
jgi:GTP cyclohydrolase I